MTQLQAVTLIACYTAGLPWAALLVRLAGRRAWRNDASEVQPMGCVVYAVPLALVFLWPGMIALVLLGKLAEWLNPQPKAQA
jgi:hypothetical protein